LTRDLDFADVRRYPPALSLDIFIPRCILRGSEFGALHANYIEADTPARNVAPARELTRLRVAHYPKPIGPNFASRGKRKPPAGILAEGFCYFGAVYARRYVQSNCRAAAPREGG
jgi:hypothetical protein